MIRRSFIQKSLFALGYLVADTNATNFMKKRRSLNVRLLRHATLVLEIEGKRLLVDPMLSKKEMLDPVANAANTNRIPLVDLPVPDHYLDELLKNIDAVLITHTHKDHWDIVAQQKIYKSKLILCQPADEDKIKSQGFTNVKKIEDSFLWNNIYFFRTNGQHGTGDIAKKMGVVSGFVITYKRDRLYIAGDTIWCKDVADAITTHKPTHIIVNGGGAQFLQGAPITMTIDDVLQLAQFTETRIDVVHLNAVNHCYQTRSDFRSAINNYSLAPQINIPGDGNWIIPAY